MNFSYINRNYPHTIALFPGWATDTKIFDTLNIHFNYIIVNQLNPWKAASALAQYLTQINLNKIHLLGWSMGAYIVDEMILNNPHKISSAILISAKPSYTLTEINDVKDKLKKNRVGYLYQFYKTCFSKFEKKMWHDFKKNLLPQYLETQDLEVLMDGLDFLAKSTLHTDKYKIPIKWIHGQYDEIASFDKVQEYAQKLTKNQIQFKIENQAGHIPFLNSQFKL